MQSRMTEIRKYQSRNANETFTTIISSVESTRGIKGRDSTTAEFITVIKLK